MVYMPLWYSILQSLCQIWSKQIENESKGILYMGFPLVLRNTFISVCFWWSFQIHFLCDTKFDTEIGGYCIIMAYTPWKHGMGCFYCMIYQIKYVLATSILREPHQWCCGLYGRSWVGATVKSDQRLGNCYLLLLH